MAADTPLTVDVPLRIASSQFAALPSLAKEIVEAVTPVRTITSKDVMATRWTDDVLLYAVIKSSIAGLSFSNYQKCLDELLCRSATQSSWNTKYEQLKPQRSLPFTDSEAYRLLLVATEAFVATQSAISPMEAVGSEIVNPDILNRMLSDLNASDAPDLDTPADRFANKYLQKLGALQNGTPTLPYLNLIATRMGAAGLSLNAKRDPSKEDCEAIIAHKLTRPIMIELIWSYWHEQGMQVQTMHALRDRFLNRRSGPGPDPLATLEISPARRLVPFMFQHIQNEQHRLTIARRAYEYDHQYGLTLQGSAVPPMQTVDSRSRFLEAFHNLLACCVVFFREDDDTNRRADAFPVLNALKEVHFLLAEGAHNQYGDLPTTARIEMLIEQWFLARPELQQFLPSRDSIAYPEPWMGTVDAMKTIQGWTNTSVMYFHDLATFGEQVLLSIRFNNWSTISDRTHAANWARVWRSEIQGYMHAYRTVTGVDHSVEVKDAPLLAERNLDPSVHLLRRYQEQRQSGQAVRGAGRLPGVPTAVRGPHRPAGLPAPKSR
ncbi:MAG TPA: hypothetical protein DDY91_06710 [Planctomycetaceae bacterium]|nr:hypothetical protein [Planctomycetaceae bacterium]